MQQYYHKTGGQNCLVSRSFNPVGSLLLHTKIHCLSRLLCFVVCSVAAHHSLWSFGASAHVWQTTLSLTVNGSEKWFDLGALQNVMGSSSAHATCLYQVCCNVRQTNKPHQKHNLLGGGNKLILSPFKLQNHFYSTRSDLCGVMRIPCHINTFSSLFSFIQCFILINQLLIFADQ